VAGRFDAVLERPNGSLILTDLKSGPNAVLYPHATAIQLALYARAPHISDNIHARGDKAIIEDWREMPDRLDRRSAYVLLAEPDADIGTLHEIDIQHGWSGASHALAIVNWRKQFNNGKGMVREIPPYPTWVEQIEQATSLGMLRQVWNDAKTKGELSEDVRALCAARSEQLQPTTQEKVS
jgi:hypothetical protein